MFVKKAGKYYLTLTERQVSNILGLIHSRIYDLYAELRKDYPDLDHLNLDDALEVYPELEEKFVEYLDLQDYLIRYQINFPI